MNLPKKNRMPLMWLLAPAVNIYVMMSEYRPWGAAGWAVQLSFLAISAVSSFMLFRARRSYSLNKIFWIFSLLYFGILPQIQYSSGAFSKDPTTGVDLTAMAWGETYTNSIMFRANMLILLCLGIYTAILLGYNSRYKNEEPISQSTPKMALNVERFKLIGPGLLVVCAIAVALITAHKGFSGLFLRSDAQIATEEFNKASVLLADKVLRGAILYVMLAGIWLYRHKKIKLDLVLFMIVACLLVNFPLALPRYLVATIYLALLLSSQAKVLFKKHFFTALVFVALLLAQPLLNIARGPSAANQRKSIKDPSKEYEVSFMISDFDAYTSLCHTMWYTEQPHCGITWGRQLVGTVLFFVPRAVWGDSKPVGSGAFIYQDKDFNNRSCPYIAEGYINFGVLGSMLFTALMALLIAAYDHYYWRWNKSTRGGARYLILFYPVAFGLLLFILRGDLMSSFAYSVGLFITGYGVHLLMEPHLKAKRSREGKPSTLPLQET